MEKRPDATPKTKPAPARITEQERQRRLRAIQGADAINAIEGAPISDYAKQLSDRWANGEITHEEMVKALTEYYQRIAEGARNMSDPAHNNKNYLLEQDIPPFLAASIADMQAAREQLDRGEECPEWDCDFCRLQSDINIAETSLAITPEQAWHLREKYLGLERPRPDPPPERPDKIIFLDIDGVLNSDRTSRATRSNTTFVDRRHVVNLKRIIDETGAGVVLSSDWRYDRDDPALNQDFLELEQELAGYGIRFCGHTPVLPSGHRGSEIQAWLEEHPEVGRFVILDDRDDMEPYMDCLVQTAMSRGLEIRETAKAICLLNGTA